MCLLSQSTQDWWTLYLWLFKLLCKYLYMILILAYTLVQRYYDYMELLSNKSTMWKYSFHVKLLKCDTFIHSNFFSMIMNSTKCNAVRIWNYTNGNGICSTKAVVIFTSIFFYLIFFKNSGKRSGLACHKAVGCGFGFVAPWHCFSSLRIMPLLTHNPPWCKSWASPKGPRSGLASPPDCV